MDNNVQQIFSDNYLRPIVTIQDLLDRFSPDQQKYFRVPVYQRGYAWGIKQCEDLWNDINRVKNNPNSVHYVGTLSLKPNKDKDNDYDLQGSKVYSVVDGQQRFTTLIIIIRLLIERINREPNSTHFALNGITTTPRFFQYSSDLDKWVDYFENSVYKCNFTYATNNNYYFTNLRNTIEFFNRSEKYDKNYSKHEDKKNYPPKHFGCNISSMSADEAKTYLDTVLKKLLFTVNIISAENNSNEENLIFESMNNRGKTPTRLEVLKNRLMCLTQPQNTKLIKTIYKTWAEIYENLGKDANAVLDDNEFLKCHWYMYHGEITKQSKDDYAIQIFDREFSIGSLPSNEVDKKIGQYVQSMKDSVKNWRYLNVPHAEANDINSRLVGDEIKKYIERLSRLIKINKHSFIKSFLLSVLCADPINETLLLRLLTVLERYLFIVGNLKQNRKSRNSAYDSSVWATRANLIYNYNKEGKTSELNKLIEDICNEKEKEIVEELQNALNDFYNIKQNDDGYYGWNGRWYFLFEYDLSLTPLRSISPTRNLDWNEWDTIEHILPETPKDKYNYWATAFGNYISNPEAMKVLTHSLGNLLPLNRGYNASLSNADFYTKCNDDINKRFAYKNGNRSTIEIERTYPHWTATAIYDRLNKMAQFLFDEWIKPYTTTITADDIKKGLKEADIKPVVPDTADNNLITALDNIVSAIKGNGGSSTAKLTTNTN